MAFISKTYRKILVALLACLGFAGVSFSCDENGGGGRNEYGSPSADYKAKGVVVSEADESPIIGIQAVLKKKRNYASEEQFYEIGSTHTNITGNFSAEGRLTSFGKDILYVELTDVDGAENGLFATTVIEADFRNVAFTGSSQRWYRGTANIDLGAIKMTPVDNNTPE